MQFPGVLSSSQLLQSLPTHPQINSFPHTQSQESSWCPLDDKKGLPCGTKGYCLSQCGQQIITSRVQITICMWFVIRRGWMNISTQSILCPLWLRLPIKDGRIAAETWSTTGYSNWNNIVRAYQLPLIRYSPDELNEDPVCRSYWFWHVNWWFIIIITSGVIMVIKSLLIL